MASGSNWQTPTDGDHSNATKFIYDFLHAVFFEPIFWEQQWQKDICLLSVWHLVGEKVPFSASPQGFNCIPYIFIFFYFYILIAKVKWSLPRGPVLPSAFSALNSECACGAAFSILILNPGNWKDLYEGSIWWEAKLVHIRLKLKERLPWISQGCWAEHLQRLLPKAIPLNSSHLWLPRSEGGWRKVSRWQQVWA